MAIVYACDELLSDLLGKFSNSYRPEHSTKEVSKYGEYFLGSIIVSKRNGKNYLVDGPQRVTSLTILLICLYRIAEEKSLSVLQTIAPLIFSDKLCDIADVLTIRFGDAVSRSTVLAMCEEFHRSTRST